ncbi:MAG TPA: GntG family PLP-dependent aldolase [Candidatus Eisenbacteria bacterium]
MPNGPVVDLRSDTVTRPTPGMREAIARAEVGDDVFGDDPTVLALERRVATLTGKEAGLFVPSGTMGNQLAVNALVRPGDLVVLEAESHIVLYEQGGVAANSGALVHVIRGERGVITARALEAVFDEDPEDDHVARPALLCLENTHNRHGGAIVPLETLRATATAARARGMRVHLDGARLWNASIATGIPVREWAAPFDTLMMCFSKGLGAPVGSILAGEAPLIRRARRVRKRWGGGMRQAGLLAAACLYALDHHLERLADDHRRARALAAGLRASPGVRVAEPETNIVLIELEDGGLERAEMLAALEARGVRMIGFGPRILRAITHLDLDDAGIARAAAVFRELAETRAGAAGRRG